MNLHKLHILALALCLCACGGDRTDELAHHHNHAHEHAHNHDHDADHDEADEDEISLDEATAERFGVRSEVIEPADFHEVLTVSGRIENTPSSSTVVAAPTAGIVRYSAGIAAGHEVQAGTLVATVSSAEISGGNADKAAMAAYEAAKREYDRVEALYREGLVTVKAYNDALAAVEQAQASFSRKAVSGRATAVSPGIITLLSARDGEYVDAGAPLATVSSNKQLTLRADVPQRHYKSVPAIRTATVQPPYGDRTIDLSSLGGRPAAKSGAAVSDGGYIPVYFTFANDGSLIPGAMVKVNLIGAPRHDVISVPVSALSEQQGAYFVYQRLDEDCFRKIPVKTGASDGMRTEITEGLNGGEDIVVEGTVAVRLAESSNIVPEGHSHNH